MLVAVVIMFAVCYFPVHLLSVLRYVLDMEQNDVITFLALISHVLCYANSAINPLIYNFMSGKYRREFHRAFCCASSFSHDTLTTMTRLTTSKKKYDQAPDQRCEHMSLKRHTPNIPLTRNNYGHTSLRDQGLDSKFKNHCENASLKCFQCNHEQLHNSCNMFSKCNDCNHVNSKGHNYDHDSFQVQKCDLMNNGQRRCMNFCTYNNICIRQ
ncbi:unnamed protein product [Euphydryas editha]|nr:unnamed protein product [Euphydryas editha]